MFNNSIKKLNIFVYLYLNLFITGFISRIMFGLFKKKSEKEKLQEQYEKLLKEAHALSTSNRKMSDQKVFEAEEIMKKLENLA